MTDTRNYTMTLEGNFHESDPVARALCKAAFTQALARLGRKQVTVSSTLERSGVINLKVTDDEAAQLRGMKGTAQLHGLSVAWKVREVTEGYPVDVPLRPITGMRTVAWPDVKPVPLTHDGATKAALAARQQDIAARIAEFQEYQQSLTALEAEISGETRKMLDGSTRIPQALADRCDRLVITPARDLKKPAA